ncbi:MAG: hypothetical protein IPM79_08095 [Polyangiaceae bacterium]|jgi:hypothetical protein|nr:hypothetical protein [Polyangiaceae bacterium]MBK8937593.1 hypothetical protein [Polyangiaceae bacterium]
MRARLFFIAAVSAAITLLSFFAPGRAEAAIVKVKVKAEVSAPFLVVKPPRPIVRPKRITLHLHRPGVTHVRLFGHHHPHHVVRVGHHAPHYSLRAKIAGPKVVVAGPGVHVQKPGVVVHKPGIHIGGPSVHIGGPSVKVKGHHGHGHGGKGRVKVKF